MARVAVTGTGVLCPLGADVAEFERRMFAGESGIREVRGEHLPSDFPVGAAGVVDGAVITGALARDWKSCREKLLALDLRVVREATAGFGPDRPFDSIVYGGFPAFFYESVGTFLTSPDLLREPDFGQGTEADFFCDRIARHLAEQGLGEVDPENRVCINSACATGTHAIGMAYERIREGSWKRCLVVASDWRPLESGLMNFLLLGALSRSKDPAPSISRPFDRTRSGLVRSQAGGALVLEACEDSGSGGLTTALAEISGFGLTSDAYRLTDGREDTLCLTRAMEQAVSSAGISRNQVDYINAHGTSTPLNDRIESAAIRRFFGERAGRLPVSSLKSQIGHAVAAAGVVETIGAVLMLRRQRIAPTINYQHPDPECALDVVPNVARRAAITWLLKNSIAFGGQNACLVLRRADPGSP